MKRSFLLILCIFFALITFANAGELYSCIDRDGNRLITDAPQDGMTKCVVKDSYRDPTPQEKAKQAREAQARSQYIPSARQESERVKQGYDAQRKKIVELEKNRLEAKKDNSSGRFSREWNKTIDKRKEELEKDSEQYFYNKEQREKAAAAKPAFAKPSGAINVRTGEYYEPAAGGVVDPRTGTFHQDVGGGYINTKTGEFSPKTGP